MLEKTLIACLVAFVLEVIVAFVALGFHLCGNSIGIVIAICDGIVGIITTAIAFVAIIIDTRNAF